MMIRREFITLLGGIAIAWPFTAHAQQTKRIPRIGVLMSDAENDLERQAYATAMQGGLKELGWTDGHNVQIDYRWASGDADRLREFAKELVDLQPDVILGRSTPAIAALVHETRTIPIVFTTVSDPIGSGFIASLAHPGGNVTGFTNFEASIGGKWLGLLKEIAPGIKRVAMMFNPELATYGPYYLRPFEGAAKSFKVEPISASVHDDTDIERVIAAVAREGDGGVVVLPDAFTTSTHRKQIIEMAARYQAPAIYPYRFMAADGGLMSYGIDVPDLYRRAASYVDRIIRGAKPADLPVQQPTKFELVINLKTAKTLGLDVPMPLLIRVDEVIE
jgi:putative tryptophan/tyrosine transport system substrate-binding protein